MGIKGMTVGGNNNELDLGWRSARSRMSRPWYERLDLKESMTDQPRGRERQEEKRAKDGRWDEERIKFRDDWNNATVELSTSPTWSYNDITRVHRTIDRGMLVVKIAMQSKQTLHVAFFGRDASGVCGYARSLKDRNENIYMNGLIV